MGKKKKSHRHMEGDGGENRSKKVRSKSVMVEKVPESEYEEADEIDEETGIVRKVRRQTKARRLYQVIQKQRVSDTYTSNTSDTEVTVYGDDGQPIMETDSYGNSVPVRKRRPKSSRRDNKSKKSQPGTVEKTGSARWDFPDT